jgi:hypothetical protein
MASRAQKWKICPRAKHQFFRTYWEAEICFTSSQGGGLCSVSRIQPLYHRGKITTDTKAVPTKPSLTFRHVALQATPGLYLECFHLSKVGTAQSVQRRAMGWAVCGSIPGRARYSSLRHSVQTRPGAHTTSNTMSIEGYFPGGEADQSPPSGPEVKNSGAIPPLPHISS